MAEKEKYIPSADAIRPRIDSSYLPVEILANIFLFWAQNGHRSPLHYPCLTETPKLPSYSPTVLLLVCKHWKAICDTLPSLWATFTIHPMHRNSLGPFEEDSQADFRDPSVSVLSKWLEHSKNVPLCFNAIQPTSSPEITSTLLAQAHRWKTIAIGERNPLFDSIFNTFKIEAPLLEGLALIDVTAGAVMKVCMALARHPRPTITKLYYKPHSTLGLHLKRRLPLHQLTELRIDSSFSTSMLTIVLKLCPKLLHATFSTIFTASKAGHEPVESRLQTLYLSSDGESALQSLGHLSFPRLRTLGVRYVPKRIDYDTPSTVQRDCRYETLQQFAEITRHMDHLAPIASDIHVRVLASGVFEELGSEKLPSPGEYKCHVGDCAMSHAGWATSRSHKLAELLMQRTSWNGEFSPDEAELDEGWTQSIVAFREQDNS
ncbi:hypothetical protein FA15DRAFT_663745 [Coprinopsis marcescibilis]|uniref:Uncharacterized protein n=1 Tax=Coprinopsis marcescibilis TaxID=230819 RepID=A0A5C3LA05_COPMA|nr:hypothetical protein FA15DRAFT_663745 [Coprinopsis marcescibilis]